MISFRNYFTVLILIVTIFVLFMFTGISKKFLADTVNHWAPETIAISSDQTISRDTLNLDSTHTIPSQYDQKRKVAMISSSPSANNLFIEWCVYNKYLYKVYEAWPTREEMKEFDVLIIADLALNPQSYELLTAYSEDGITMIFTKLPSYNQLAADPKLASFLGIKELVSETVEVDGIKIFSGFMLNKERIYEEDDFYGIENDTRISIPYYGLRTGYEVYATGIFEDQKAKEIQTIDLPPLLWRTVTNNSFVFVVNSDIFQGAAMLGILTGFLCQEKECFLYPIINAQTISLLSYPYFSNENQQQLETIYSRSPEAVSRDLLWPNIVQVLKNYGSSYIFFAAPQLDYEDAIGPKKDFIDFYVGEISELPGSMGLSLDQVSEASLDQLIDQNQLFFQESLPNYTVTALYSADHSEGELLSSLNHDLLAHVSLIMSDYKEGEPLVQFLNDTVLSVKFNLSGYQHETLDDIRMCSLENALGMCNAKVDIKQVLYPNSEDDQWNLLTKSWSKGSTYYNDFSMFDTVSIYEMEKRIRRFLALDYTYYYHGDQLELHIDSFDEEAFFILSIDHQKIANIQNAEFELINEGTYLIRAVGADVNIQLLERNTLKPPKNSKRISFE
jgi:hypothetical protein